MVVMLVTGVSFVVVAVIGLSPNAPLLSIDHYGLPHGEYILLGWASANMLMMID
jgi:hypothetical protein